MARNVIALHGFAGSSIDEIARAAQMSVGAIYLHFRSKDDLCVSLVEDALDQAVNEMASPGAASPHRCLAASWGRLVAWADEGDHARILRVLAGSRARAQLSAEVVTAIARGTDRAKRHLAACVQAGSDAGLYRGVNAQQVSEALWALLLGCLDAADIQANLGGPAVPLAERAQQGFALIEHALLLTCPA